MAPLAAREEGSFAAGHTLNATYRIERLLGQGGMASVFEVSHVRLPRRFALKVITAPDAQSAEYMLRFRREAEILASLDHPNLVNVIDWNTTPSGQPYLVMELLCGEDLAHLLQRSGALPLKMALSIFAQAAAALGVAHSRGITHRDLKPANIFLCKNGLVPHFTKVLDFGIAKSMRHTQALVTDHLVLMGTPAYMAPEQARGDAGGVDARADQFSLALVLYELLSGKSAFYRRGEPAMSTLCRVLTDDPEPLADAPMNRAILRALNKDPEARYPSLSEMVAAVISASAVPLDAIEIPERTDRITGQLPGDGAGPSTVPPKGRSVVVSTRALAGDDCAADRPPDEEARPRIDSHPPQSLLSNRRGEILPQPKRKQVRLRSALAVSTALTAAAFGVGLVVFGGSKEKAKTAQAANLAAVLDMAAAPALLDPPADLSCPGDLLPSVDLAKPKTTARTRYEPRLDGLSEKSASGQYVLRCIRSVLGQTELRHHSRAPFWLGQGVDGYLHVASQLLPGGHSMQLEQCLVGLKKILPTLPSRVDITIVEVKSP